MTITALACRVGRMRPSTPTTSSATTSGWIGGCASEPTATPSNYGMLGTRADNVWSWSYVLPGPAARAVWTKQSDTEYTVDGPSYPANGKRVTEHHRCRKVA